ncbi:MAG: HlyD family secretion protein [Pirellulaceae bacterium]
MVVTPSFLAALLLVGAPQVTDQVAPTGNYERVSQCVVMLIDEVEVPARETGVLKKLALEDGTPVKEGLVVHKDQILGKLDDADALARRKAAGLDHEVAIAEEKKAQASIKAADATVLVPEAEVVDSEAINKKAPGAIPPTQIRRQRLTKDRSETEATVAQRDAESAALTIQLREAQVEIASLSLNRHRIESPLDGVVVQMHKHVGEWVNPGDPILRIVHLDELRVEGFMSIRTKLPEEVEGRPVTIQVRLRDDMPALEYPSVVSFVSPLVEATGVYRVWAEVDTSETPAGQPRLRPGMKAEMLIYVD